MVTIREVAREAGVSIGTVSRALNNRPGVGANTREHILAVSQRLGYVPSKRLPLSTHTVTHLGVLIRPIERPLTADPFFGDIFHATERALHQFQISLAFSTLDIVNGRLRSMPAMLNDERISGIVVIGALPRSVVETVATSVKLPLVLVDNDYEDGAWDSIMIDNRCGATAATEYLIEKGHRHIGLISGPDHPSVVDRRAAYVETMQKHGLDTAIVTRPDLTVPDGETAVVQLLKRAPQTTAVFCSNDNQAIGAMRKLRAMGYSVPEDFSLVGFDDIRMVQFTSPPITTINVDRTALGQLAAQLLLARIDMPDRATVRAVVSTCLVERDSVARPRAHAIGRLSEKGSV